MTEAARDTTHETTREPARVTVRILEKEYAMVCPYEERSALLDSAEFLNARMREIRDSGKVVGSDRIAVMVALNLANEYLKLKEREAKLESEASGRVRAMRERVEAQLAKGQQLEF
jgi:cell division protein ZapA